MLLILGELLVSLVNGFPPGADFLDRKDRVDEGKLGDSGLDSFCLFADRGEKALMPTFTVDYRACCNIGYLPHFRSRDGFMIT